MTPLQDKLRAALRETADEIPAEAPPLHLSPRSRASRTGRPARWRAWAAPLAAAALVMAAVAGSVTVAGSLKHQPAAAPSAVEYGVPPYYVALITSKTQSDLKNMLDSSSDTDTAAELRSTQSGAVLATITPPKPYVSFTGVTAAADDRTFVLVAQGPEPRLMPPFPAQRFFLLRIDPAARAGARTTLTALPAAGVPAGSEVRDMALSPDGTRLAANISNSLLLAQDLDVFNLATGTERSWTTITCARCLPVSGGMLWFGVDTDALSWTADSQQLAFIWDNTVRLLDTRAAGSGILTDSKTVATWTGGVQGLDQWRGAIITPDGRTVLGIESLSRVGRNAPLREHLVSWSTATGRQTAVLNNLNALKMNDFEQILYTSDDGSVLVLTYLRPGANATIVHDGRSAPIPWSPRIAAAAW
jgi:WD40 repeat protein